MITVVSIWVVIAFVVFPVGFKSVIQLSAERVTQTDHAHYS
jgi:hypothetical protein